MFYSSIYSKDMAICKTHPSNKVHNQIYLSFKKVIIQSNCVSNSRVWKNHKP